VKKKKKEILFCQTNTHNNKYTHIVHNHGRLPEKKAFTHQSWPLIAEHSRTKKYKCANLQKCAEKNK